MSTDVRNKVAVIINTRNRPEEYEKVLHEVLFHSTQLMREYEFNLFVVDDASSPVYCDSEYRFEKQVGIPRAKNKGLRLAYDWGAEHFFLFDDDVYPVSNEWWKPYIESGLNHLAYTFTSGFDGTPGWSEGYVDRLLGVVVNRLSCGCMMYIRRKVLDTVGGMDVQFGVLSKFCDTEWQRRIYAAGLTPYPFIDVIGSDKIFHSMDKEHEVARSFSEKERTRGLNRNRAYYEKVKDKARFCGFN